MKYLGIFFLTFLFFSCANHVHTFRSPASSNAINCNQAVRVIANQRISDEAKSHIGQTYLLNNSKIEVGEYISEGRVGFVYFAKITQGLENYVGKKLVIKIEKKELQQNAVFAEREHSNTNQYRSLKQLEEINFPAVKVIDASFDHSTLLIEHVRGYNLMEMMNYYRLDPKFAHSLVKLTNLLSEINKRNLYFQDLHYENIMFDLDQDKWLVVDESYIGFDGPASSRIKADLTLDDRAYNAVELIEYLKRKNPQNSDQQVLQELLSLTKIENGKFDIYKFIFDGPEQDEAIRYELSQNIKWKKIDQASLELIKNYVRRDELDNQRTNCHRLMAFKKLYKHLLSKEEKTLLKEKNRIFCQ